LAKAVELNREFEIQQEISKYISIEEDLRACGQSFGQEFNICAK
jgi:hypothetical protein